METFTTNLYLYLHVFPGYISRFFPKKANRAWHYFAQEIGYGLLHLNS